MWNDEKENTMWIKKSLADWQAPADKIFTSKTVLTWLGLIFTRRGERLSAKGHSESDPSFSCPPLPASAVSSRNPPGKPVENWLLYPRTEVPESFSTIRSRNRELDFSLAEMARGLPAGQLVRGR